MLLFVIYIYNSRNYSILLNDREHHRPGKSTTVEIILYYLTIRHLSLSFHIYNSRNYSILLNMTKIVGYIPISTTVEIILYYLTLISLSYTPQSTTVEIILYYLTIIIT